MEKFGNKVSKIIIFVAVILSICFVAFIFIINKNTIISGSKIADFERVGTDIAVLIDGEKAENFPEKGSGIVFESLTCENDTTGTWNFSTWTLSLVFNKADKCTINFVTGEYRDGSGAIIPELYSGLIPIKYDSNNNIVVADINDEWYNYNNHEWANAILIDQSNSTIKNKYLNNDGTYKYGTQVNINDVLQMYVWIPRYKYQLFNVSGTSTNPQMINIEFEGVDTVESSGKQNGEWLTHPAFTFGTTKLNGIWVGKFETSGSVGNLTIKPDITSLRNITLGEMFNASRAIETNSKYGLNSNEVDTHMMKNMEWGAIAYLTSSKYGRYVDSKTCISSGCEVWPNTNSSYLTGCSASSLDATTSTECNKWNSTIGVNASTTGNIYGIYDMSGGAWDYVMGNMVDVNNNFFSGSASLNKPDSKYYNSYAYSTVYEDYERGLLGDATKEVIVDVHDAWYNDYAYLPGGDIPWIRRGGHLDEGDRRGIFYFTYSYGAAQLWSSFHSVLTHN